MDYIRVAKDRPGSCIFCELPARGDDVAALVLTRADHAFLMMNSFPYNPGHLMAAPFRHIGAFEELTDDEIVDLGRLLQAGIRALRREMEPDGYNVGMNLGRVAGAGFPDHLHWHVVPRWDGDTNFMPVVGETRVVPELVEQTYRRLAPRFTG
jgi:ATP adenylyltransferase